LLSTEFTRKSPLAGYDLVESKSLALTQGSEALKDRMVEWMLVQLKADGFSTLKAAQLNFLGAMECGANFGSELARTLGVSRQAIHKTVRDLENAGWLRTEKNELLGNQRVILFTDEGERMMACARKHFLRLDELLLDRFSASELTAFFELLAFDPFDLSSQP